MARVLPRSLVVIALLLGLAGCGSDSPRDTTSGPTEPAYKSYTDQTRVRCENAGEYEGEAFRLLGLARSDQYNSAYNTKLAAEATAYIQMAILARQKCQDQAAVAP
jgi:hypothetical protein